MDKYLLAFKKFGEFHGRSSRSEFWYFVLFNFLFTMGLMLFSMLIKDSSFILNNLYSLAVLIPGLSLSIRRLHDINKSGWWLLIPLVPLFGSIIFIVFMATKGQDKENQYGLQP